MRRLLAALTSGMLLATMIPTVVLAGPSIRFEDHSVGFFCEGPIDGGFLSTSISTSSAFGDFASADVWLEPAIPFEGPPSLSGSTDAVQKAEDADQVDLSAEFTVFDAEGNELGTGRIEAILTPDGPPEPVNEVGQGNRQSVMEGTRQAMSAVVSLTLPGLELDLDGCSGERSDLSVFETDPTATVISSEGVFVDCFWQTEDATAYLYVIEDTFGSFADAGLMTGVQNLVMTDWTASVSSSAMAASISLRNDAGDPFGATASASLAPTGEPVTSNVLTDTLKRKLVEQALVPDGELTFSTGDSFEIDDAACSAVAFASRSRSSGPAGPKPGGKTPANDAPDGAVALASGSRLNAQTMGTAVAPEAPITTCPEGEFDAMGHTLWYTIEGSGDPITIDTAGSNIDTLLAVYVPDGDGWLEIACIDDVFADPVGVTYQAAVTIDTVDGHTYYVQVGGYDDSFFGGGVEIGRVRLEVE